jgi:hypothetical protein
MRQLVANNIRKLINKQRTQKERRQTTKGKLESQERQLINNIKKKINQNKFNSIHPLIKFTIENETQ